MTRLTLKLAFAGIRTRRLQTALTLAVVAISTATLAVALDLGDVADRPFERTFDAANGAHVTVFSLGTGGPDLRAVESLPGVTESTGLVAGVFSSFENNGRWFGLSVLAVGPSPPNIQRPLVVEGTWPTVGEVLLERSFARFLDYHPGDRITTTNGPTLVVSGVAALPVGEGYPRSQPGTAFAQRATLIALEPNGDAWGRSLGVRLADPESADAFAAHARQELGPGPSIETWLEARTESADLTHTVTVILGVYGTLLLLTLGAVVATLVGARIAAQTTQIAILKATGLTPRHVAGLYLGEQLVVAVAGCAVGLIAGHLATPFFASPSGALLGASESPHVAPGRAATAVGIVLGLVAVFTLLPALRAARQATAVALRGGLATAATRSRLGRAAVRLGLPLAGVLGVRRSFARPGRATLSLLSLAVAVVAVVGTLGMEASLDVGTVPPAAPAITPDHPEAPAWDPVDNDAGEGARLRPIVYSLDALLLLVGLANLLATLILTTREQTRDLGMLKAVGLTPRQLLGTVVSSQAVVAFLAALAGIPLGLALFRLAIGLSGSSDEFAYPAAWTLPLIVVGVVLAVAVITFPLARHAAAVRVADALRYE